MIKISYANILKIKRHNYISSEAYNVKMNLRTFR
jgi:hypothetical protein